MTCSVRMTESEQKLVRDYAKFHGITISQALRQALLDRIEDEMDAKVADLTYDLYLMNPVSKNHEEAWQDIMGEA